MGRKHDHWKEVWERGYPTKERNIEIYKARENGETFVSIGKRYGITTERARQLWKRVKRQMELKGE